MDDGPVEAVRGERAPRTARIRPALDRRAEHEVVDEQLRATVEEVDQRLRPVVGLEAVVLLDRDPGQRLPPAGELVAPAGELLLLSQELGPRSEPLLARAYGMVRHVGSLHVSRVLVESDPGPSESSSLRMGSPPL